MNVAYTPKDAALDVVGVILICLPEPVTTPIGLSILCRKRGNGAQSSTVRPLHNYPEYVYKVDNIRGREITWEARTLLPGQLPLHALNKPDIEFRGREEYIKGRKIPANISNQPAPAKLPPGVKIHHTIITPARAIRQTGPVYIPGETIHHALRELPQAEPALRRSAPETIHHTVENSPAYIQAQAGGIRQTQQQRNIHHSIDQSMAAHVNNPVRIERPVIIRQHHTLNTQPSDKSNGSLIPPPPMRRRKSAD